MLSSQRYEKYETNKLILTFFASCLFLKKVDSILTLKINISISVRNQLTLLAAEVDLFSWNG